MTPDPLKHRDKLELLIEASKENRLETSLIIERSGSVTLVGIEIDQKSQLVDAALGNLESDALISSIFMTSSGEITIAAGNKETRTYLTSDLEQVISAVAKRKTLSTSIRCHDLLAPL